MHSTLRKHETAPPLRRRWTNEEDEKLLREVETQSRSGYSSNWKALAEKIPGRSNKDCRKRWIKIKTSTTKGPWDWTEDERLRDAVEKHGFKWVEVSRAVGSRNSDQCAKRWNYAVDPTIDRSPWKSEEDEVLIFAVSKYGPAWRSISEEYFPRRATTDIKNRHIIITGSRRRTPMTHKENYESPASELSDTALSPDPLGGLEYSPMPSQVSSIHSFAGMTGPESLGHSGKEVGWLDMASSGLLHVSDDAILNSVLPAGDLESGIDETKNKGWVENGAMLDSFLDELMNGPFDLGQHPEDFTMPLL